MNDMLVQGREGERWILSFRLFYGAGSHVPSETVGCVLGQNYMVTEKGELGYYSNGAPGGCSLATSSFRYTSSEDKCFSDASSLSFCVGRVKVEIGIMLRPCEVKSTK